MRSAFETAHSIAQQALYVKRNYKRAKGLSLAYIRYRIIRPMLKVYNWALKFNLGQPPWMGPAAIRIFKSIITKDMQGFEYGSGKSTIFFASLCKHLVSIEHHKGWFNLIKKELAEKGFTNIDYHYVNANTGDPESIQLELKQKLSELKVLTKFTAYFSFIDRYKNAFFDFVIVDGRARPECVWYAMPKVKPGGFIVLDNAERNRYAPIHLLLKDWKKVFTTTGLTDTIFWFKPNE